MGPDVNLDCTLFVNSKCKGKSGGPFGNPGIANFQTNMWWQSVTGDSNPMAPMSYFCAQNGKKPS